MTRATVMVDRGGQSLETLAEDLDSFAFVNGDVLTVKTVGTVLMTPDGCTNLIDENGLSHRIPPVMEISRFRDYEMPEHLVVLTGRGTDTLENFGRAHIASYKKHMGLEPEHDFLEIGCGIGRDAFQLSDILAPTSNYVGVDVTREAILWCRANLTARHPNFAFHHFDAEHELYNPLGTKVSMDFKLPTGDSTIDRISLGSVFTHLFEDEMTHYLTEIARVLRPGGLCYATFFLHADETLDAVRSTNTTPLRFEHPYGDGCFIDNPAYPTGAVAFTDAAMKRMMKAAGLILSKPYIPGAWSGRTTEADDGQDVAILTPAK